MKELALIQTTLKAPKGQENKFGKYKYRSCEDILESLKPLLAEHKCSLTLSDDIVEIAGRVYVKATAILTGEEMKSCSKVTAFAREAESKKGMDEAQITGSASSYARKYALNGLFAIDDTKDPDATNDHGNQAPKPPAKPKQSFKTAMLELADEYEAIKKQGVFEKLLTDNNYKTLDDVTDREEQATLFALAKGKLAMYKKEAK